MFKKKISEGPESFDTLIGSNSSFEGNVESEGTVRVDGKLKGDMHINGDVFIGAGAVVTGSIYACNITLSGTVHGNVQTKGILRLLSTARLFGDITVQSFVADEGGILQGKCSMVDISGEKDSGTVLNSAKTSA